MLVARLRESKVSTAVDLGTGSGVLLSALAGRWPAARYISVDIDPVALASKSAQLARHQHFCLDALDSRLSRRIRLEAGSADAAVCNPPFIKPEWRSGFSTILARAGLPSPTSAVRYGADVLFLAQNLWMLRKGGQLGIIVPAGVISGSKGKSIREALLAAHTISDVIELPARAFKRTEVKTFATSLTAHESHVGPVTLGRFDADLGLMAPIEVTPAEALERLDYGFYEAEAVYAFPKATSCRTDSDFEVLRGNLSMTQATRRSWRVLHTSQLCDFRERAGIRLPSRLPVGASRENVVVTRPGDIVMGRVGRNALAQINVVESGTAVISDCVHIIRPRGRSTESLFAALCSPEGQQWLAQRMVGACARFIAKASLEKFPF